MRLFVIYLFYSGVVYLIFINGFASRSVRSGSFPNTRQMEWIPNDEDFQEDESYISSWYIPGIEYPVDISIYIEWSNINRGKKPGLE